MFAATAKIAAAAAVVLGAVLTFHSPVVAGAAAVGHVPAGAETSVPYGWVDFCQRYRGECDGKTAPAREIELNSRTMREIERINRWVNQNIEPVSDMDHWGVVDQLGLSRGRQRRLRGLCAAEAQAARRTGLPDGRAADDGCSRQA